MGNKTEWFKGIFPALVTPFTKSDEVDEDAYRALIRHVLPHVDGLVPAGTTGEFSYLSIEERKRIVEIAVDEADGRVPVVAGTGAQSTRETVELTRCAKEAGAAGALVVAPYYLKPSFNEVYEHFERVNEVGLPIILYNIPQCSGSHFRWWTAEGMAKNFENVVGLKDSSGDLPFMEAMFEKVRGEIGIFVGHDEVVAAALAAGADGAILASANLIPDLWQKVYRAVQEGDIATAQKWQAEVQKLVRIVVRCGSTQAVKEGLGMMGVPVGDSRHPIMPGGAFRREDREELRIQLENLGKIGRVEREFDLGGKVVTSQYPAAPYTPARFEGFTLKVGEGFAGPPFQELAHIDLLLGVKEGPVGRAIERALDEGRPGHEVRVISERPRTLLVPTVTVRTAKQRRHVYEEAAQGVVQAIKAEIGAGVLPEDGLDDLCMVANVFVHPAAAIRQRVMFNNFKAMRAAIRKALEGRPALDELLNEKEAARHPFRYAP
ncbi:MAG: 4-hydroxy-tetrahydrodipicolinate synthase [Chloroflexota bacterium]|nr:4-hydroxy-tetrahydrodipicolinate synthase [Chloroflexota bacterium]